MRAGDLVLVGGKPGQGKTVAALQWARQAAMSGATAIVVSYEHDHVDLVTRVLASELACVAADHGCDELRLDQLRSAVRAIGSGARAARETLDSDHLLREAEARLASYGERLVLAPASGARTDVSAIARLLEEHRSERTVLFVDYLQKVPVHPEPTGEAERVKRVAENLKELALNASVPVVAITAADRAGIEGRRLRLHHFRGSTALAYEADLVIVLNEKFGVVSKVHLAYDTARAADFRRSVVFSIEKNRSGEAGTDLEFRKDFANYRFHPVGSWVRERLWEEGTVEE